MTSQHDIATLEIERLAQPSSSPNRSGPAGMPATFLEPPASLKPDRRLMRQRVRYRPERSWSEFQLVSADVVSATIAEVEREAGSAERSFPHDGSDRAPSANPHP